MKPLIYAMTGGNGSGKTTFARNLAKENKAIFFSLDGTIKGFNKPIHSYEDYLLYYQKALDLMATEALLALKEGLPVVFDFGGGISSREWLRQIAHKSGAQVEIYHLQVPLEERRIRIRRRNLEREIGIFFFHMGEEEFDRHNKSDPPPPPEEPGIKVICLSNC